MLFSTGLTIDLGTQKYRYFGPKLPLSSDPAKTDLLMDTFMANLSSEVGVVLKAHISIIASLSLALMPNRDLSECALGSDFISM